MAWAAHLVVLPRAGTCTVYGLAQGQVAMTRWDSGTFKVRRLRAKLDYWLIFPPGTVIRFHLERLEACCLSSARGLCLVGAPTLSLAGKEKALSHWWE